LKAEAHVLKTDKDIGVIMHIDPEDDPIIASPANLFFELKDRSNKFNSTQCDCTIKILKAEKELFQTNLFERVTTPTLQSANISYVFPEKGVYTIQIHGTPNQVGQFQEFTIPFDLRITRTNTIQNNTTNNTPLATYALFAIILALVLYKATNLIRHSKNNPNEK
jgi:hypothetical protein